MCAVTGTAADCCCWSQGGIQVCLFFLAKPYRKFFSFYTQPSIFAQVSAYNVKCYQIGYISFSFFFCYSLVGNFIEYVSGGYYYKTTEIAKFSIPKIVSILYWYKKYYTTTFDKFLGRKSVSFSDSTSGNNSLLWNNRKIKIRSAVLPFILIQN